MASALHIYRAAVVLLAAALVATLTVALTGGQRADAVDGPVEVVYIATGQNFPDALAGANLAATVGAPMLTVNPDLPIPDPTITALQALDPNQIIILGGPVAVSDAVKGALGDYTRSGSVTRIEGSDRHDTAAQIADALPDKVHDADKLDGLDSGAYARSGHDHDAAYAGAAPRAIQGLVATELAATGTGGSPLAGMSLVSIPFTTLDECGDGSTRHTYVVTYTGNVSAQVGQGDDGEFGISWTTLTLDSDTAATEGPGFQSVVVDGSNLYSEKTPISVSRIFADVAPGAHDAGVRTYTTSTSDFALLHEDGTAIVQDTGFTCG